jgi:antitoxin ParD1/3/4
MLGHRDVTSTRRYAKLADEALIYALRDRQGGEDLSPACPPGESGKKNINENNLLMVEAAGVEPASAAKRGRVRTALRADGRLAIAKIDISCYQSDPTNMNVSLTEELEELVQKKVESGRYSSASEVIRAGLRLLEQEDELRETRLAAMRARVQEGIEQAERGELVDGEEAVARAKKRAASKRRHSGE